MDKYEKISKYFTIGEATFLPQWLVYHNPSEEELANIKNLAEKLDKVREFLGYPIHVHCWIRPILNNPESPNNGQDYNKLVGGAAKSAHRVGLACDFHINEMSCDEVREKLAPKLKEFELRMEDLPGSGWVHLDAAPVPPGGRRFFKP